MPTAGIESLTSCLRNPAIYQLCWALLLNISIHQVFTAKFTRAAQSSTEFACIAPPPPLPTLVQLNKLVIEPRLVPTQPVVVTAYYRPLDNDPSLQSTWSHRAWMVAGCTTLLISLGGSIKGAADLHMYVEPIIASYIGYILSDLGSGIYHWGIDNYGDGSTPFVGTQIEAFKGHHKMPWTITRRVFANNLHALARAVTFTVLPIDLVCHNPTVQAFVGCLLVALCLASSSMPGHMGQSRL
ncbi:hypothetical protein RIF29_29564 [Crotalaria pallida]|uniref:Lipid desaturase domain-containing protein n=1 Tax=Crotalaria pallida TaxID=3830 RepID=A0AAN9EFQ2_CROPI